MIHYREWNPTKKTMDAKVIDSKSEIIMRCTEFIDRNGKLIYEGDIVQDVLGRYYKIVWEEGAFKFNSSMVHTKRKLNKSDINDWKITVVGNVHQTPELLQKVK